MLFSKLLTLLFFHISDAVADTVVVVVVVVDVGATPAAD